MAMEYVGNGTYIHGVPARDLEDDEDEKYAEVIKEQYALTGRLLYRKITKKRAAKKSSTTDVAVPDVIDNGEVEKKEND